MIPLPPSPASALLWADRLYAKVAPLPSEIPEYAAKRALEAYRQIARRYDDSPRTARGVGNCLMAMGRYDAASKAYPPGSLRADAVTRAELARLCRPLFPQKEVLQLERVPRTKDRWVVLYGRTDHEDGESYPWFDVGIEQIRRTREGVNRVGTTLPAEDRNLGGRHVALYVTHLRAGADPVAILYRDDLAANCWPSDQRFYRLSKKGLRRIHLFQSVGEVAILPATKTRGLRISVTPTYKVGWSDVYEWRNDRFEFANARNPDLYRWAGWIPDKQNYIGRAHQAVLLTIQGRYGEAIRMWRIADRLCRKAHALSVDPDTPNWINPHYGDPDVYDRQIRQRIRWLGQRDLNHALLYRPYDRDLQTWPYRLGRAGNSPP